MINYHSIETKENNLLYGPGNRAVLFCQGCGIKCSGCSNSHLWKREEGKKLYRRELIEICAKPDIQGITLHGGEPTEQTEELLPAVKEIKAMRKSVILLTGHEIEQLTDPLQRELVAHCDIVKCGPYVERKRNLFLHFRGSDNQRVIINPKGALKDYKVEDGTNTVLVTLDRKDCNINVNGMLDSEMEELLREYAALKADKNC